MRKLLFNYSFYSHPEIGNFRVWHVHACPTSRPVAYIAAPAEAPACPSSPCLASPPSHIVRRNREAPPPAVPHPPAVESRRRNRRHQQLCEVELGLRRPARRLGSTRAPPVLGDRPPPMHHRRPPPPKSGHPRWSLPRWARIWDSPPSPLSIPHLIADPSSPEPWHRRPSGPAAAPCCSMASCLKEEEGVFSRKSPCQIL
jgi:hypothetical protein